MNFLSSMSHLTMRNTRRYGGYVVHIGMVLIFIGLSGAAFNKDRQGEVEPGSRMQIGPYTLAVQSLTSRPAQNYTAERITVDVLRDGKSVMFLYPERRFYPANDITGTMVSIHSTLKEDLYVVYAGRDAESNRAVLHAYLNPLVKWIWLGGVVLVLGTVLALVPNRQPVMVLQRDTEREAAAEPLSAVTPQPVGVRRSQTHEASD